MKTWLAQLTRYIPEAIEISSRERARSLIGASLGIFLTGLCSRFAIGSDADYPWLVAPMGASALLLFTLPSSPLAQPWSVIGGNVISALIGVSCAKMIGFPVAAASVAVAAAIGTMFLLRCLHPPGGAVALGAALGGPELLERGYQFALAPIVVNSLILLAIAIVYNKLCGRRYPHLVVEHGNRHRTADIPQIGRAGFAPADIDYALKQSNRALDISRDDLAQLLLRTEMHAFQRHFGEVTCADIMSRDVVTVEFGTELQPAWRLLRERQIKALPVVNRFHRVIGIVTAHDFIRRDDFDLIDGFADKLRRLLARTPGPDSDKNEVVGQIMTTTVQIATSDQPIASLVPLFTDTGLHHLPIVDANQRLVGIVTQSDLIAALYRSRYEQHMYSLQEVAWGI